MILITTGAWYGIFFVLGGIGGFILGISVFTNWDGHFYFKKGSDDGYLVFHVDPEKMRKKDYLTIKVENLDPDKWDKKCGDAIKEKRNAERKEEWKHARTKYQRG